MTRLTAIFWTLGMGVVAEQAAAGEPRVFYADETDRPSILVPLGDRYVVDGGHLVRPTRDVVVRFDDGTPHEAARAATAGDPEVVAVERLAGPYPTYRFTVRRRADPVAVANRWREHPAVRWAHPDFAVTLVPTLIPNDEFFRTLWHLHNTARYPGQTAGADVGAVEAWDIVRGEGAVIAIMDTGVDLAHEDLDLVPGWDFVDHDGDPSPVVGTTSYGHGTACAGAAAAVGGNARGVAGVAFAAKIMPIRVIGDATTLSDVRNAFVWAADHGAAVLSNSWSLSATECPGAPLYGAIREGIGHAVREGRGGRGSVVLFGVGNGGCDITTDSMLAYEPVLGVGASDDTDHIFGYSNFGPWIDVVAPSGPGPGSPGSHQYIRTTDITGPAGYSEWSSMGNDAYADNFWGTSAAAPIAAGVAALVIAANPRLTEAQVRAFLQDTAAKIDPAGGGYDAEGHSPYYGYGRVDAAAAVSAAYNRPPPAPIPISPVDNDEVGADAVMLRWEAVADPDGDDVVYDVELYDAADPDSLVLVRSDVGLAALETDVTGALSAGASAIWRVWAVDLYGRGDDGAEGTFRVVESGEEAGPEPPDAAVGDAENDGIDAEIDVPASPSPGSGGCTCTAAGSSAAGRRLPLAGLVFVVLAIAAGSARKKPGGRFTSKSRDSPRRRGRKIAQRSGP